MSRAERIAALRLEETREVGEFEKSGPFTVHEVLRIARKYNGVLHDDRPGKIGQALDRVTHLFDDENLGLLSRPYEIKGWMDSMTLWKFRITPAHSVDQLQIVALSDDYWTIVSDSLELIKDCGPTMRYAILSVIRECQKPPEEAFKDASE